MSAKNIVAAGLLSGLASLGTVGNAEAGLLTPVQNLINANHLILNFDFQGTYKLTSSTGRVISYPQDGAPIGGKMSLDLFTMGGAADMTGYFNTDRLDPDAGVDFTAVGPFSAYLDLLGSGICDGGLMCASSKINFKLPIFTDPIVVFADFRLDPILPFGPGGFDLSALAAGFQFKVSSIDTDNDGMPGTKIIGGGFNGFTPSFDGIATISGITLGQALANPNLAAPRDWNSVVTAPIPEPGEWAMMLAGLGLVAFKVRARREKMAA